MADDQSSSGNLISVSLGKEIDAALGDVIRGLLKRAAEEVGGLLADTVGILGDKIRIKRQRNAALGMEEVRKKLHGAGINLNDIASPKEEELYLLMNGLSLADDGVARDVWAGLFANSLNPKSAVKAERPFLSVLDGMSPLDIRLFAFLSFIVKSDTDLRKSFKLNKPKDLASMTPKEREEVIATNNANSILRNNSVAAIEAYAEKLGLDQTQNTSWSENLMRLGIIERVPLQTGGASTPRFRNFDAEEIHQAFELISRKVEALGKIDQFRNSKPSKIFSRQSFGSAIQLEVQLSGFGLRLAEACGLTYDIQHEEPTPSRHYRSA